MKCPTFGWAYVHKFGLLYDEGPFYSTRQRMYGCPVQLGRYKSACRTSPAGMGMRLTRLYRFDDCVLP